MGKMIVVDLTRCVGCHSCEIACAVSHSRAKDLFEAAKAGEKPGTRLSVLHHNEKPIPLHCHHCDDPVCMAVCPSGAVHRSGVREPVLIDEEKCVGCRMCLQACPFGMITLNANGKGVLKCDLCAERLAEEKIPACVEACPTGALLFTDESQANKAKHHRLAACLARMDG